MRVRGISALPRMFARCSEAEVPRRRIGYVDAVIPPSELPMQEPILRLAQELIRIPSQADIDAASGVLELLDFYLRLHAEGSKVERLSAGDGRFVGLVAHIDTGRPGPRLCLDAPIDTAPAGDLAAWSCDPFDGVIVEDRLYGRGAADCKTGAAILAHLAIEAVRTDLLGGGTLDVLFDADEHTGGFEGVRRYLSLRKEPLDFASVLYPGDREVVRGARGFWRARILVHGRAGHSGSRRAEGRDNAVTKAAQLVEALRRSPLPREENVDFAFGPALTITGISGGRAFHQIPDLCSIDIDARLTPGFRAESAEALVREAIASLDASWPTPRPTEIELVDTWPSYSLEPEDPWVRDLQAAARHALGRRLPSVVCGPSNIGNYFAAQGIPATCGFGVACGNLHAADEWVEIDSILPTFETYVGALRAWSRRKG